MSSKRHKHTKYYDLLDVEPTSSPEELKKAYRRKALLLHPDKRGNNSNAFEAQEEFMTMKAAYDVLIDPRQREIYDLTGEAGLKMVSAFADMTMDDIRTVLRSALASLSPCAKAFLFFSVLSFLALVLVIPLLWCFRADDIIDWSWVHVFMPIWIFDSIYVCWTGCAMAADGSDSMCDLSANDQNNNMFGSGLTSKHASFFSTVIRMYVVPTV
jgi:hypothetical protein